MPTITTSTEQRAPVAHLIREAVATLADGKGQVTRHTERNIETSGSLGGRHYLTLHFNGCEALRAGEALVDALPSHTFSIPGHMVCEAKITEIDTRPTRAAMIVRCEISTLVEEWPA